MPYPCHRYACQPLAVDENQVLQMSSPPESMQPAESSFFLIPTDFNNKQIHQVTQSFMTCAEQQKWEKRHTLISPFSPPFTTFFPLQAPQPTLRTRKLYKRRSYRQRRGNVCPWTWNKAGKIKQSRASSEKSAVSSQVRPAVVFSTRFRFHSRCFLPVAVLSSERWECFLQKSLSVTIETLVCPTITLDSWPEQINVAASSPSKLQTV